MKTSKEIFYTITGCDGTSKKKTLLHMARNAKDATLEQMTKCDFDEK